MSVSPVASPEWSIARLLSWTADFLQRQGVEEGRLAGEILLAKALDCPRIQLYTRMQEVPAADRLHVFREWVKRAAAREPIAYLVGEKEFFSLTFQVTPDVLIPRPETETLVECLLDFCTAAGIKEPRVWDLGTGSGCIAIAVLKHLPGATAVGSDASEAALQVAQGNAERHGVADRYRAVLADGVNLPGDVVPPDGFHLLACNPPYIEADAVSGLPLGVRDYEPRGALTDGADGLTFYRAIAADGGRWMTTGGAVMVEVADDRAEMVRKVFEKRPGWAHRKSVRDRVTGRERVVSFLRSDGAENHGFI